MKGDVIPLSARITALADVYDALRSKRPYKDPWSHDRVVSLMKEERGKQFEPIIVDAFLAIENKFDDAFEKVDIYLSQIYHSKSAAINQDNKPVKAII